MTPEVERFAWRLRPERNHEERSLSLKFWINHPATQDEGPVSFLRWLAFQISERLYGWQRRLEHYALYYGTPHYDDDIPF